MTAESGWAVGVGAATGILSWVVGLGTILWPKHPALALFLIAIGVSIFSMLILDRKDRRSTFPSPPATQPKLRQ